MAINRDSLALMSLDELLAQINTTEENRTTADNTEALFVADSLPELEGALPPLSYAQERLWFMDRLAPNSPFYNIAFGLEITGPLNTRALQAAWQDVVARHETLTSTFPVNEEGKPGLRFIAPERCCIEIQDISALSPRLQEETVSAAKDREVTEGFFLEQGPLLRAVLLRHSDTLFTFLYTFHHIIFDGWSIAVFMDELFTAYKARCRHEEPNLPKLPATYGQYALWQCKLMESPFGPKEFNWWKEYLLDTTELELWSDFPRPDTQSFKGSVVEFSIPTAVRTNLESLAQQHGATPFMVWLALYAVVLGRLSGRREFTVGNSVAGRTHPSTEKLIGFFVNNMVVKISNDQELPFTGHLERVRDSILLSFEHGELPFQFLAKGLGRHLDLSRNPIYQSGLTYQNMPPAQEMPQDLSFRQLSIPIKTTHLDIHLLMWPGAERLSCSLSYTTDLFSRETAENICASITKLAEAVALDPQRTVADLFRDTKIFPPHKRGESIISAPDEDFPFLSPWERIQQSVAKKPDSPALIVCDDMPELVPSVSPGKGTEYISNAKFASLIEETAADMAHLPVGRGHITAILLYSGVEMLTTMLAIWHRGGAWLPLDPDHPPLRQCEILRNIGADCIISTPDHLKALNLEAHGLGHITTHEAKNWRTIHPTGRAPAPVTVKPEDFACIYHTSGSTGSPKGVPILHGNMSHRLSWEWKAHPIRDDDVVCMKTAIVFVDFFTEAFSTLLSGTPFLLLGHAAAQDVPRLMEKMEQYNTTKVIMVASLLKAMHRISNGLQGRLQTLRRIRTSGEPMEVKLAADTLKAIPGVSIINMFGSTEMLNPTTFHFTAESAKELDPAGIIPAGNSLPGRTTALLDDNLLPVPRGERGIIYAAGPGLTSGYLSGNAGNAFHVLALNGKTQRFFRSGDLGYLDERGRLNYLGRNDHQIKVRGVRIESAEVQAAMLAFEGVQEAMVATWRDADENTRLVGFVIREKQYQTTQDEHGYIQRLRNFLLERLPPVMVPDFIKVLEDWPRTPSGKISRPLLLENFTAPATQNATAPHPADDTVKGKLSHLWSQVIGTQNIAGHSNFFEAGGNSLLLVNLHERIQKTFAVSFPLTALFQNPTIESQTRYLNKDPRQMSGATGAATDGREHSRALRDSALGTRRLSRSVNA